MSGDSTAIRQTILQPDSAARPDTLSIILLLNPQSDARFVGFTFTGGGGVRRPEQDTAWTLGGAVFQLGGSLTIERCIFTGNRCDAASSIWSEAGASLHVSLCEFCGNFARQGGIVAKNSDLVVDRSRLHHEEVFRGSVIRAEQGGTCVIDNCVIDSNVNPQAWLSTVFLFQLDSACVLDCDFIANRNRIPFSHGALAMQETPLLMKGCRFLRNNGDVGTALDLNLADAHVRDCLFEGNENTNYATGAVWCDHGRHFFENCRFVNNRCTWWSVFSSGQGPVSLFVENCAFLGNVSTAFDSGAAIAASFDTLCIQNCEFDGNLPAALSDRMADPNWVDVRHNYWGDPSGPFHATRNPSGLGDWIIGDHPMFEPWLTEPPSEASRRRPEIAQDAALISSYPNPFNAVTRVSFHVPVRGRVEIAVFNVLGERVAELAHGVYEAGRHELVWEAGGLPSGVYFANLRAGWSSVSAKMLLLK